MTTQFDPSAKAEIEYHISFWEICGRAAVSFMTTALLLYLTFLVYAITQYKNSNNQFDTSFLLLFTSLLVLPILTIYRFGFGAVFMIYRNHVVSLKICKDLSRENADKFAKSFGPVLPSTDLLMLVIICILCISFNAALGGINAALGGEKLPQLDAKISMTRSLYISIMVFSALNAVDFLWDFIYLAKREVKRHLIQSFKISLFGVSAAILYVLFIVFILTGVMCVLNCIFEFMIDDQKNVLGVGPSIAIALIATTAGVFVKKKMFNKIRVRVSHQRERLKSFNLESRTIRRLNFAFIKIITFAIMYASIMFLKIDSVFLDLDAVARIMSRTQGIASGVDQIDLELCILAGIAVLMSLISFRANPDFFFPSKAMALFSQD